MRFNISFARLLFAAAFLAPLVAHARPATPQEALHQYVSDLQRSPDDIALREKIIRHVRSMKRVPAIPEDARRYFIEGNALLKAAKEEKGYELAIDAYRQCLLIAPWWPEANYNFAVALELANRFDSAVNALKLYIATDPGEDEARKAQDRIYEIGAKKIIAAREREESSPEAVAARKQNRFEEWLRKLDGRRYVNAADSVADTTPALDIKGNVLIEGVIVGPDSPLDEPRGYRGSSEHYDIQGREALGRVVSAPDLPGGTMQLYYIISEDGERITQQTRFGDGSVRERTYLWQR